MTFLIETMIVAVIGYLVGYYLQPLPDAVIDRIRKTLHRENT